MNMSTFFHETPWGPLTPDLEDELLAEEEGTEEVLNLDRTVDALEERVRKEESD
jgi:hypothetical protein